ncbi:MAG: Rpn family recombination-promoting nuclease/putative transposase [Saprospiraceae bacterium]|nr:Rpn family recombination-promoting nuclease/putative transposase [Saprospiraceae bacterium]
MIMALKDKYINPFTDFGFKKLFGTELNKDLLIDFLNEAILPKQRKITDLTYRKNEHVGATEVDRKAIFDLYCIGSNNERFVVEMQKAKQNYFKDRSVFYASFPIQEQAQRGDWDFKLSEVFTVGILDFAFSDDSETHKKTKGKKEKSAAKVTTTQPIVAKKVRHEVQLKDQDCHVFYDKLTFIYLEMPHFTKTEDELETTYDKWLYVLKHLSSFTERPSKLQEKIFDKLFEAAEIARFTKEELDQYEDSLKYYRDLKNVIDTSFGDGKLEGLTEGIIKGKIEGKIEGLTEGIIKGKTEEKTKNIIIALKRGKLTTEEIAEDFDVSVDFVLQIKEKHNF